VFTDLELDDLGIWRRVLSVQEVASIFAKGTNGLDLSAASGGTPVGFTRQPLSTTVSAGGTASLSVATTGSLPMTYQWTRNGETVNGATGDTLVLSNVSAAQAGDYAVVVSNLAGAATSAVARVEVFAGSITQDLVAHLKFDDSLADASGRNNNGTAIGLVPFVTGQVGTKAVRITSGADYVTLGTPADLNFGTGTDFSVAFWAKSVAWSGDPSFIGNKDWDSGNNPGWVIATDSDGRIQWNTAGKPDGTTGDRKDYDSPAGVFSDGAWHHILVSYDRQGYAYTYVDGQLRTHRDGRPGIAVASPANLLDTPAGKATNIGQDGTGTYGSVFTDVTMDDLGIWRRIVTPQEAAAIYNAGLTGKDLTQAGGGSENLGTITSTLQGNTLTLQWTDAPGVKLQKTSSLTQPTWVDVLGAGTATETIGPGNAFYRLIRP
jgi:hypothetical protein